MLTATRNSTLDDLANMLLAQKVRKLDQVVPASEMFMEDGILHLKGVGAVEITLDGVTTGDGLYNPTSIFDEGVADKLKIPLSYVRRMREENIGLYDANVNGWLKEDGRSFMVRAFVGEDGGIGIGRAFLSNTFKRIEHLDVLTAALAGIYSTTDSAVVQSCDLTDRRMRVKLYVPEIMALAPTLLAGYRNPFASPTVTRAGEDELERGRRLAANEGMGYAPGGEPIVFAGLEIGNSETGNGAFVVIPRFMVKVCTNGLIITKDIMRAVHLGSKLDDGEVKWSDQTQELTLALITSKTEDVVKTVLSQDYLDAAIQDIEEKAGAPVKDVVKTITTLGKQLQFDEATTASVLAHFTQGGQLTAGGVMNAVTSVAQTIEDADKAATVEAAGYRAMELAAASA